MSTKLSCAQCGATLRPDHGWCSVCFSPVAADFDPLTAPLEEVEEWDVADAAPTPAPAPRPVEQTWGQPEVLRLTEPVLSATPGTQPELASDNVQTGPIGSAPESAPAGANLADVDVMLSMLAAEHRQGDPTAVLADRMGDRSVRMLVMFGGMAVVAVLAFVGLTTLGLIF